MIYMYVYTYILYVYIYRYEKQVYEDVYKIKMRDESYTDHDTSTKYREQL